MGRVLILGIDGAEPSLLFRWALAGRLPNFARLLERGARGPLQSTIHPLTPQAWTSLITGVNPGRHGIFDFGKRAPKSYDVDLVTAHDRRAPAFWQFAPEGAAVGVANVPLTWPPEPLPGFMMSGMHTPTIAEGVWPPEIAAELGDGYRIDAMVHWYDDPHAFLADVFAMFAARHQAFLRLWDHHPVDLGLFVYVAADRIQHALWGALTPEMIADPGRGDGIGEAIFQIHLALDRALDDWLERLAPDDHLLIASDHGFGDLRRDVYLNRLFIDTGILRFDPEKVRAYRPPPAGEIGVEHAWTRDRRPPPGPSWNDDQSLALGLGEVERLNFATVDWSSTVAYSRGLCGNVWLNLQGREPEGIVEPREVRRVREQVKAALRGLTDPDDRRPVVDRIIEKEEIYHGDCLAEAPDLLVVMRDYAYTTRGATEFWSRTALGPVVVEHTGNHRLHGVFAAAGPKIRAGEIAGAGICDVIPTAFHLLGWPVPSDLDGKVLTAACDEVHRQVVYGPPTPEISRDPEALSAAHRAAIIRRLKDLGYLG